MIPSHQVFAKPVILAGAFSILGACTTTPDPIEVVEITPPKIEQSCYPIASLEKVVVPAVTRTVRGSTSIESPSEFYTDPDTGEVIEIKPPPVESYQEHTILVKEEEIYYQTPEGTVVTDICELHADNSSPTPAAE